MRLVPVLAVLLQLSLLAAAAAGDRLHTSAAAPLLHCTPPGKPCKGHPGRCCGAPPPSCARPCPAHRGRTYCSNVKAAGQCERAPAPCPTTPCPPPPPPAPPPPPPTDPNCAYLKESDTGAGVSDYGAPPGHFACVPREPTDPPRLLLFAIALSADDYTEIVRTAADVGMYAIGLMYQNKPGSFGPWPSGFCAGSGSGYPNTQNVSEALCVHRVELMKAFGQGDPRVPPNRANYVLSRANSIVGRTAAVLRSSATRVAARRRRPAAAAGPAPPPARHGRSSRRRRQRRWLEARGRRRRLTLGRLEGGQLF
eukprot:SAG11_NODE_521_length_8777_cov_17.940770_7_plen_310_part_00